MRLQSRAILPYLLAVCVPCAAGLLRIPFAPILQNTVPFLFYFPAVAVVAWMGGTRPGWVATVVSVVLAHHWTIGGENPNAWLTAAELLRTLLFAISALLISYLTGELHRTRKRLLKEAERFRVTLSSIGDAVIATDRNGAIVMMNAEAERLTGWSLAECRGRPLRTVFRILSEVTRETVDDPVEKVFKERRIVGLANHTLLIAKDGQEYPIEDSAAPIVTEDRPEDITGVVLVFKDATQSRQAQRVLEAHASELERRVLDRTLNLQRALRDMEQFSYSVSHDLRGPLRIIRGYATLLLEEDATLTPEEKRFHLERIRASTEKLDRLTYDLLAYSRVSSREMAVKPTHLLTSVKEVVVALGMEKTVQVELDGGEWALANDVALHQVLTNLLENAGRFMRPDVPPVIRVRGERGEHRLRVVVEDNGIGIEPRFHEKIFKMFERLEPDRYAGTGVGLALAQRSVERMQGKIGVESTLGEGSRFWFELAMASAPST